MKTVKTLLLVRLRSVFSSLLGRRKDGSRPTATVGRMVGLGIAYLIIALSLTVLMVSMSAVMAMATIPVGMDWFYFATFTLLMFSFIFVFGIFETKSELFECKDNELLLSMPINPRHIVISRMLAVLVYNYVEALVIFLPAIIVYLAFGGGIPEALGAIITLLFVPLLATALSSGVGYIVARVAKKVKKNSFVTLGLSLLFLALYMVGYNALINGMTALEDPSFDITDHVKSSGPMYYLGLAVTLHPLWTTILIALAATAAYLAYRLISDSYVSIVSDSGSRAKEVYKEKRLRSNGRFMALTKKELYRFISSAAYMLNGGLGAVFILILGVAALFAKSDIAEVVNLLTLDAGWLRADEIVAPIATSILVMLSSMVMLSSSALSLEGRNVWIIKSMPISAREVLFAKAMPHLIVSIPPVLIASVCLIIATEPAPLYWLFYILTPVVANIAFALFGILMNTAFPKFDYENEAQPIKQSLPVFISTMGGMLAGFGLISLSFTLALMGMSLLVCIITLLLLSALAVVSGLLLAFPAARKFDNISV